MTADVREAIRTEALARGFDAVGFAAAHLAEEARADLAEFLARGYHGQMDWLAAHAARRGDPQTRWADARTVVVLGLNYGSESDDAPDGDCGIVSVYARGRDYHDTIKKRLKALARWIAERWPGELKVFVDTAPVMEKPLAQQAGIGWQGKHTNLVSRDFGSWLFLGEIYLSLELEPDAADEDHCGSCRQCLDACPTKAFPAPYGTRFPGAAGTDRAAPRRAGPARRCRVPTHVRGHFDQADRPRPLRAQCADRDWQ
jgi:epoxyqueuosine reductase